jgi:hypothetical protein
MDVYDFSIGEEREKKEVGAWDKKASTDGYIFLKNLPTFF